MAGEAECYGAEERQVEGAVKPDEEGLGRHAQELKSGDQSIF